MGHKLLSILRYLGVALLGYLAIALGTTLVLEVILGGVTYHESSPLVLVLASFGGIAVGLAGGLLSAWLGRRRPLMHAAGVSALVALDTTSILVSDRFTDPKWFTLVSGLTLIAAVLVGAWLYTRRRGRVSDNSAPGPVAFDEHRVEAND